MIITLSIALGIAGLLAFSGLYGMAQAHTKLSIIRDRLARVQKLMDTAGDDEAKGEAMREAGLAMGMIARLVERYRY